MIFVAFGFGCAAGIVLTLLFLVYIGRTQHRTPVPHRVQPDPQYFIVPGGWDMNAH